MPHIHEAIDFVVSPIIIHPDKDKILLVEHPRYGKWISIGGHIELDEQPDQALLREIKEECGLDVEVLSEKPMVQGDGYEVLWQPRHIDIHDANAPHRHIGLVYYCLAKSADFIKSDEHTQMAWVRLEELSSPKYNVDQLVVFYAQEAIKESRGE